MAYEERDLSGVLFKNNKKTSERAPDYTGKCLIGGESLRIAAWINEGKSGIKFMSLKFEDESNQAAASETVSDDVPF